MTFDKKEYWKNRNEGKRGQGDIITVAPTPVVPPNATIGFSNSGEMIVKNRKFRRTTTSLSPKSSQLRKKGKRKSK